MLSSRGSRMEYFEWVAGDTAENDILENVPDGWSQWPGGSLIQASLDRAAENFNPDMPWKIFPDLYAAWQGVQKLPSTDLTRQKSHDLVEAMLACTGLWAEATVGNYGYAPGDSLPVRIEVVTPSPLKVWIASVGFNHKGSWLACDTMLRPDLPWALEEKIYLLPETPFTGPYWLEREKGDKEMFRVGNQQWIGQPENPFRLEVEIRFEIAGHPLSVTRPLMYKWRDPVYGERYRPVVVMPAITVTPDKPVALARPGHPALMTVTLRNHSQVAQTGQILAGLPDGWETESPERTFSLRPGENTEISWEVTPRQRAKTGSARPVVRVNGSVYNRAEVEINYEHIPRQYVFPRAATKLVSLDYDPAGLKIGYIEGAGDDVAESLMSAGYSVQILGRDDLNGGLSAFDAVIFGIRAFNVNPWLKEKMPAVLQYAENGGNVIVQYNTNRSLVTEEIGPYPLKLSRERVTVEEVPVTLLVKRHPVFNHPLSIGKEDFRDWVQERGLYFAGEWDGHYTPLLAMHDPGEEDLDGSLLVADYGKGTFIYTGLSFFRQLPAGVRGAYRLMANLIAYGQDQ